MSKRTSNRKPAAARLKSWYLPLHQDAYFEALATGVTPVTQGAVTSIDALDRRLLRREAHGLDYGSVGLLELARAPSEHGYVLLGNCSAFWLRSDDDRSELVDKLELFQDTVPEALPLRVDAGLFEGRDTSCGVAGGELDLSMGEGVQAAEEPASGTEMAPIVILSGAIAMARHRLTELGISADLLPVIFRLADTLPPEERWAAAVAVGAVEGLIDLFALDAPVSGEELLVIAEAAELLSSMDAAMGIELNDFTARLHQRCSSDSGAKAIASKFRETISRLSDNQLELNTARIDDSGHIGLRALMVFLLAPEPDDLLRWFSARQDVGSSVSILAAIFSGLYGGLSGVPRHVKGPSGPSFLSIGLLSHSMLNASMDYAVEHVWSQRGEELVEMKVSGLRFAQSVKKPSPVVSLLLESVRGVGGVAEVNAETGTVTVGMPAEAADRSAVASVRCSRWFKGSQVVEFSLRLRRPGKAGHSRELLERLLDAELAPVLANLGSGTSEVILLTEVPLECDDFAAALRGALLVLHERAESLGLVHQAQGAARKRSSTRSRKSDSPDIAI